MRHLDADRHAALIRSQLEGLYRNLDEKLGRSEAAKLVGGLLLRYDGKETPRDERMARSITFQELRGHLNGIPEAADVLRSIDIALEDGAD